MKIILTRTNKQNKLCLSTKTMERFLERIAKDDAKQSVTNFRMHVPLLTNGYDNYIGMKEWLHVYPAAEFGKDSNDNLLFKKMNGLVLLIFTNLQKTEEMVNAKNMVSQLPMTFAAIEGADARSLIVLVSISDELGRIPDNEEAAEQLYQNAYQQVKAFYQPAVGATVLPIEPSLRTNFLITLDSTPYYNNKAVAMRIQSQKMLHRVPKAVEDLNAYKDFEHLYRVAASETRAEMMQADTQWDNEQDHLVAFLSTVASKLCQMDLSEEETFTQIRHNNWSKISEDKLRQIVGTAFDNQNDSMDKKSSAQCHSRESILQMIKYLKSRYIFRYDAIKKCTEYRPNNSWVGDFKPVTARVINSMTIDVQLADIRVSIKDVRNYLESDHIESYNPIESFLFDCMGKWDGKDRIRALARTVPTDNPHWEDWFYTWFLGMVSQWKGGYRPQYGNSTMPLLISKQGYNKSTFCRRLIPPTLSWGYNDNMVLAEKRQVLQGMAQFMLINLDEFNQISPQVQQGFLKNILQLPTVKIKPPYGKHVEEFPRLASFIATSNMTDILADPSGSRRFLGVELTGPIDVSVRLNYEQLYAQAMDALDKGEKSYFDAAQTAIIMESNQQFQQPSIIKQCFLEVFEPTEDENRGKYMSSTAIFNVLKQKFGSSLKITTLQKFGRELQNIDGMMKKRTRSGSEYLVVRRDDTNN